MDKVSLGRLKELVDEQAGVAAGYDHYGEGNKWRASCMDSIAAIHELIALREAEPVAIFSGVNGALKILWGGTVKPKDGDKLIIKPC